MKRFFILLSALTLCSALAAGCVAKGGPAGGGQTDDPSIVMPFGDAPASSPSATAAPTAAPSPTGEGDTPAAHLPAVGSVTGKITQVTQEDNGITAILVEDESGMEAVFLLSAATYVTYTCRDTLLDSHLTEGTEVTGFYDAALPITLQYPARYAAIALEVGGPAQDEFYTVDLFDDGLVSSTGMLALKIGEDTSILNQAGEPFYGELQGRYLAVWYNTLRESMPAQATPYLVVALDYTGQEGQ